MCCWQWPISKDSRLIVQNWRTREPPHFNFFQHGIGVKKKMEKAGMKEALANRSVKKTVWGRESCISQKRRHDGQNRAGSDECVTMGYKGVVLQTCMCERVVCYNETQRFVWQRCVCDIVVVWRRRKKRSRRRRTGAEFECVQTPQLMNFINRTQRCLQWIWQMAKMTVIWHKICFSD